MARPLDLTQLSKLRMTGDVVTVGFDDREDVYRQRNEYLAQQTFFISTTAKAPPFAEFGLEAQLPNGTMLPRLPARLVQIIPFGAEPGLLLQILRLPMEYMRRLDAYLAENQTASGAQQTMPEPVADRIGSDTFSFEGPPLGTFEDEEPGSNPLLDDADLLRSVASESLDSLGLSYGSSSSHSQFHDEDTPVAGSLAHMGLGLDDDEGESDPVHHLGLTFEDEPLLIGDEQPDEELLAPPPPPAAPVSPVRSGSYPSADPLVEEPALPRIASDPEDADPSSVPGLQGLLGLNRVQLLEKMRAMNPNERSRLAKMANRPIRAILMRDSEPTIITFLLTNPHLTRAEVVEITKLQTLNHVSANGILSNKVWANDEEIRYNLVRNPKTPLPTVLKLVPLLTTPHIRELAKDWGIHTQVKQLALRLLNQRGEG